MKDSFLIYKSFYKPISRLSDKQLGRLFRAIFKYQLGEEVTVEEDIEMAFEFFKNQFEIDELKYQGIVERNRNNGRKGGNDKNSETVKTKPSGSQTSQWGLLNENDNENDNDNDLKETSLSRSKEKEEDFGKDVDKPLTELREELLSNQTWIETLSMNNHIDENESRLYIEAYIRKLQNEGIARKSVSDAQQHFARWLIIELKRARDEQSGIHQKPNSKTKQERYAEFAKAIATKLATGDTGNLQDGGESALPF